MTTTVPSFGPLSDPSFRHPGAHEPQAAVAQAGSAPCGDGVGVPLSAVASTAHPGGLRRASWAAAVLLLALLSGAAVRAYVNDRHAAAIAHTTRENAVPAVVVTHARPGKGQRSVALPSTLRGTNEAAIYARTNGYVRAWRKDIGDKVAKGDVLAVIDTPEVDQDLAQAKAALQQVKARLALTQSSLGRWEGLRQHDAVSQQELDERRAAQQQAAADLAAGQANVARLQQLHDFGVIKAPFDGVVVRRNVDVGALVAAGSAANTRELFYLSQSDTLRLTVAVPQSDAADISTGKEVTVRLLEKPNAPVKGRISRISGGIDVATRSVQVEVVLPNPDGKLLPGAYAEVTLPLAGGGKALLLPPNTLQFRQDGPRVAVVGADGKLQVKPVKLGRDLGRAVEVLAGITPKDAVVLNPHDTIEEGVRVSATEAPAEPQGEARTNAPKASAPESPSPAEQASPRRAS